jgi:ribosomal-protein-alanine N-acetyltransferase
MQTNLETVTIKRMAPEDTDGVVAIETKAYGQHHWSKDSFMQELNNDLAYYYSLFNQEGKLVAYAGTWHVLDEAHITNIAVDLDYRKRNYAQALLKRIIDDCYEEKIKYITLEVRVSNKAAINLYTKYGFQSFGTRKKYYQDNNEDALIMWTKNIFYDEFKSNYNRVCAEIMERISIQ